MNVDHVDLIQLHNLVEEDEWEVAHGPNGAVEALARARDEGLARFIGVTGHGTRIAHMHLASLDRFPFDSVLLPFNHSSLLDPGYEADVRMLLERCAEQQVAVQTIKSIARRRWPDDATEPRHSWYQPLRDEARDLRGPCGSCSRTRSCSSTPAATPRCCQRSSRRPPDRSIARTTRSSSADEERFGITPLFDGDALERIWDGGQPEPQSRTPVRRLVRSARCRSPTLSIGEPRSSTCAGRCRGTGTAAETRRPG